MASHRKMTKKVFLHARFMSLEFPIIRFMVIPLPTELLIRQLFLLASVAGGSANLGFEAIQ